MDDHKEDSKSGIEVVEIPAGSEETPQARASAEDLYQRVKAAVAAHGWADQSKALADGYVSMGPQPSHYYNEANVLDGVSFDPDRPEFLIYTDGVLRGEMFTAPNHGVANDPPPGAPFTSWHYHRAGTDFCIKAGIIISGPAVNAVCPDGYVATKQTDLMMHVYIDEESDPFRVEMNPQG